MDFDSRGRGSRGGVGWGGGNWGDRVPPGAPRLDSELVNDVLHMNMAKHREERSKGLAQPRDIPASIRSVSTPFDAYVVLDFEATCVENRRIEDPEVIEFPMVIVDPVTCTVVAEFQRYVRPVRNPTLTTFCTELTGITQVKVDSAPLFPAVYTEALNFLASAGLGDTLDKRSYCMVLCGDWDLKVMLPTQLSLSGQQGVPDSWRHWCNLKKMMEAALNGDATGAGKGGGGWDRRRGGKEKRGGSMRISGMPAMMAALDLPLVGRHHSGIDDCRNIAAALCEMLRRGYTVMPTYFETPLAAETFKPWKAPEGGAGLPPLSKVSSSIMTSSSPPQPTMPLGGSGEGADAAVAGVSALQPQRQQQQPLKGTQMHRVFIEMDALRDAGQELIAKGYGNTSKDVGRAKRISKAMSYILRHGADEERGTIISENGYVLVDPLLRAQKMRNNNATISDIVDIVCGNDKQRFKLAYGKADGFLYIAARQGHSLEGVMPELRAIRSSSEVPVAVHGTYWDAWRQIKECGYLSAMTRHHIHFAKGLMHDEGVISGMRASAQVFLYLDVGKVLADGIPLLESENGVILTPGIGTTKNLPLAYIKKVVDRKTGASIPITDE